MWLCRTGWQLLRPAPEVKETFDTSRLSSPADGSGRDGEPRDHERDALYFPFIYMLLTFVGVVIICIVSTIYSADSQTNVRLLLNNIAYIITELCLVNFYLRRVKFEALSSLYTLIQSKKQYVRYISHELRTPLNSAFLGLKVVLDDLRDSSDPDDREMCETLTDVQKSCLTAVEILNDLMCFDKVRCNVMFRGRCSSSDVLPSTSSARSSPASCSCTRRTCPPCRSCKSAS
jgi:signal transduction histidine kinase